jgi:microcystin-dependent protein
MAIELRTNKASALTYNEMDRNFSSFFYSASVDTTTNRLYLWYTGSANLNTSPNDNYGPARSIEVELQPTTGNNPTLVVAGNPRNIQFRHAIDPRLDADTGFIYTTSQQLGIGAAIPATNTKIHAVGSTALPATLRLESTTSTTSQHKRATVDFYRGSTFMGTIGKDNNSNNALYIKTYPGFDDGFTKPIAPGNLIINIGNVTTSGAWTPVGLGIGTLIPTKALHVEGRGYFRDEVSIGTSTTQEKLLVNGNISTEIVTGKIGFRVWDNYATGSSGDTYAHYGLSKINGTNPVNLSGYFGLTFATVGTENMRITQAGDVGINTPTPNAKLDVNGDTIVTGSFTTTGNATIKGTAAVDFSLTTGTTVAVGTNLTVTGTATIGNIPAGTAGAGTKILTANNAGQIQYITGTFPLGGIVMWAGSPTAPPTGWTLCDGRAPVGGVTIPDLRERFIVGAGVEPLKTVIDYSAPFTLTSYVVASVNNITYTMDTTNPYYIDGAGIPRQGVNPVDGKRYHLYKGPGSTSASTFKFIIYDNRFNTYEVIQGALPTWGSAFPPGPAVIYAGDDKGGTTFYKSYESQNGRHFMSYDTFAEYDKHFVNGRRLAWKEVNWATTTSPGYAVGDKGGADNVVLLGSQAPKHQHDSVSGEFNGAGATYGHTGGNSYPGARDSDNVHNLTSAYGNNQPHENRPPYYALAFIIYTGV